LLLSAAPALALERPVRIGVLTAAWGPPGGLAALVEGLIDLGYHENEDFVIGVRFTQGDISALPAAAKAMVEGGVDLLLADEEPGVKAIQEATPTHPIIFLGVGDPIGRGLIASYNRPGGNATGVADLDLEVSAKRLQLFKDLIPGLERVLLPYDKHNNYDVAQAELYRAAAQRLQLVLVERQLETEDEARAALAEFRKEDVDGMLALQDVSLNIPGLVLEFAQKAGIPAMFASSVYLAGGGVASYGGSRDAAGKQAARLVDKIISGADPAGLPVETVQTLEFVINLRTADELGIVVPREVLFQADRILR
jgi:putative ABC transport system substrate-binding protein